MGDATVESLLSQALGSLSFAVNNIERGVDGNAVQHIEDAKRDIRAALRSDSPVSDMTLARENAHEVYGGDCGAGHDSGLRRITEIDGNGERTWYECIECGITVGAIPRPSSTGGERDEQDREHDMDLAYANGWCDREEGGIEVEASGPVDGRGKRYIVTLAEPPDEALRGPYVLLPRQVEGDDNPNENGG